VLFYVLTISPTSRTLPVSYSSCWPDLRAVRYLQAYVHVTSNTVRVRGAFYGISALALALNWGIYIFEVLTLPRRCLEMT